MKAQSLDKPTAPYELTFLKNDKVDVELFTNIKEVEKVTIETEKDVKEKSFEYDYYRFEVQNRPNLIDSLNSNFDGWIEYAKEKELSKDEVKLENLKQEIIELTMKNEALKASGLFSNEELQKKYRLK